MINPGRSKIRLQFPIPEGLRLNAQVDALVKGTKIKKSAYRAALAKPKALNLPKYAKQHPEGFLFPNTYELTADSRLATSRFGSGACFSRTGAAAQRSPRSTALHGKQHFRRDTSPGYTRRRSACLPA